MAQMEDSVSLPPRSNDRFGIRKYLLKHVWVTEALNRPQKRPIWCYKVSFFNHIVSILYERGLQAKPTIHSLYLFCTRFNLMSLHSDMIYAKCSLEQNSITAIYWLFC